MDFNIKIKEENKKEISKIFMLLIIVNVLITILAFIFTGVRIFKTIILYIMSVFYIVMAIWMLKKENTKVTISNGIFKNKYDPILTRFLLKNEFVLDNELLNAEICYLVRKGYVELDKEKNALRLKDKTKFKQIDALDRIDNNKIEEYSTDEIPSYESLFIGKILFAFHNEIDLNEFRRNQKENYYLKRGEMCQLIMEKMILYELEKKNMLEQKSNLNFIFIEGILNIITSIFVFVVIARFNIVLLLATIINIVLSAIIVKNENMLSYKYSDDVIKYIGDLFEYVKVLKKGRILQTNSEQKENNIEENTQEEQKEDLQEDEENTDEELKYLFGIKSSEGLFI